MREAWIASATVAPSANSTSTLHCFAGSAKTTVTIKVPYQVNDNMPTAFRNTSTTATGATNRARKRQTR